MHFLGGKIANHDINVTVFGFGPFFTHRNKPDKTPKCILLLSFLGLTLKLARYVLYGRAETQTEEIGGKTETPTTLTAETPDPGRASSQLRAYS